MNNEGIEKMWYVYTTEYYSAIENKILPFETISMDLEGIMLSEIRQKKKKTILFHSFIYGIKNNNNK